MTPDSPQSSAGVRQLESLLARHDPELSHDRFMTGLVEVTLAPPGSRALRIDELPEPIRMIRVLNALSLSVHSDGIGKFLESSVIGAYARQTARWCRKIGATGAARYVTAAIKRLPRGVVPKDDDARREAVDAANDEMLDGGAFDDLDDAFRDTLQEMGDRLRDYVRKHPAALRKWLTRAPVRNRKEKQKPGKRAVAPRGEGSPSITFRPPGLRAARPSFRANGDDPRVLQFQRELAKLTSADWIRIARRYYDDIQAIHRSEEQNSMPAAVIVGRVRPVGRTKGTWLAARRRAVSRNGEISERALPGIPESTKSHGKVLQLRNTAWFALRGGTNALMAYHELVVREGGMELIRTALGPFEGLVSPIDV